MSRATFMYSRLVFFLIDKLDFKEPGIKKKKKKGGIVSLGRSFTL